MSQQNALILRACFQELEQHQTLSWHVNHEAVIKQIMGEIHNAPDEGTLNAQSTGLD